MKKLATLLLLLSIGAYGCGKAPEPVVPTGTGAPGAAGGMEGGGAPPGTREKMLKEAPGGAQKPGGEEGKAGEAPKGEKKAEGTQGEKKE